MMGRKKPRTPTRTPEEIALARKQIIAANTDFMRLDDHPTFERIRHQLEERGVDPYTTILADSERGPGFSEFEEGFVVAADRRVYRYLYSWEGAPFEGGNITEWQDITDTWPSLTTDSQGVLHRDCIAAALEVLAEEQTAFYRR
jgi:hypothetical protein